MVHHAKENFGIWRNRQPHGANPTAFLSGEDLGIPSGDVGIPTQSPGTLRESSFVFVERKDVEAELQLTFLQHYSLLDSLPKCYG